MGLDRVAISQRFVENTRSNMNKTDRTRTRYWILGFLVAALFAGILVPVAVQQTEAGGIGPDVTIIYLNGTRNYGSASGMRAYSVGTTSCNIGDEPLWWCDDPEDTFCETNQHPVIAQNIYRLKDDRFEQIGASWLKHGFLSLNTPDSDCGNCQNPPFGGDQLGVGCTDAYGAGLNGSRPLGMRSEVNPATGDFPFPATQVSSPSVLDQRIQVAEVELDPTLNPGARYFIEGHYVAADDAAAENALNNASYQEVTIEEGTFDLETIPGKGTVREQAAIEAWPAIDPLVDFLAVDVPGSVPVERFHVARKVTSLGGGQYHYEYAVHNMNSDRSAQNFTIQFPEATTITNAGFRDVDHHSGEPYDTTDWGINIDNKAGQITWFTDTFGSNPNANALRWGTMFSFWFDASASSSGIQHSIGLFKKSSPSNVNFLIQSTQVFDDGFESGDTSSWASEVP